MLTRNSKVKYLGVTTNLCKQNRKKASCPIKDPLLVGKCEECPDYIKMENKKIYIVEEFVLIERPEHGRGCICKMCVAPQLVLLTNGLAIKNDLIKDLGEMAVDVDEKTENENTETKDLDPVKESKEEIVENSVNVNKNIKVDDRINTSKKIVIILARVAEHLEEIEAIEDKIDRLKKYYIDLTTEEPIVNVEKPEIKKKKRGRPKKKIQK